MFCCWWPEQRRQRWKKAVECILHSQLLFLLSPGVYYSACLHCQNGSSGYRFPKTVLSTVQCEQVLSAGLFFLASDRVWCSSALVVVSLDLDCCRERCFWCPLNVQAAVAPQSCLLVCVQQVPAHVAKELPACTGALSPPVHPRTSPAHVSGWVGSLSM